MLGVYFGLPIFINLLLLEGSFKQDTVRQLQPALACRYNTKNVKQEGIKRTLVKMVECELVVSTKIEGEKCSM